MDEPQYFFKLFDAVTEHSYRAHNTKRQCHSKILRTRTCYPHTADFDNFLKKACLSMYYGIMLCKQRKHSTQWGKI
jgi:hypothetical protein